MKLSLKIVSLLVLSILVLFVCCLFGSVQIKIYELIDNIIKFIKYGFESGNIVQMIVLKIRLPRLLMAFLGGAILSIVGMLMQAITKNPLAEPYVLGISAGASAGAVSAIILGWFSFFGTYNVYFSSFIGALLATGLVILLQGNQKDPVRLVLMGMGVNAFFTALTTFMVYSSKNEAQVRSALFWTTGSLTGSHYRDLTYVALGLIILIIYSLIIIKELNLLLLGQEIASTMGLKLEKLQIYTIIVSSLSVAILVSKVGVIGFVGLIIPHISRKIIGIRHKDVLFLNIFFGGMGLMIVDTFARTLFSPNELPIGVMTGLIGAPIFIYILKDSRQHS